MPDTTNHSTALPSYRVESNVPMPSLGEIRFRGRKGASKYPFAAMKPGDSFLVKEEPNRPKAMIAATLHTVKSKWRKRTGNGEKQFTIIQVDSPKLGRGVRVYRTA